LRGSVFLIYNDNIYDLLVSTELKSPMQADSATLERLLFMPEHLNDMLDAAFKQIQTLGLKLND
jgi:hypothetical protein